MIPVSSKESVEYKDKDGVVFTFKPKSGTLEREMWSIWKAGDDNDTTANKLDAFIDKILLSPKADYNSEEKARIIKFWHDANALTVEEKKS